MNDNNRGVLAKIHLTRLGKHCTLLKLGRGWTVVGEWINISKIALGEIKVLVKL